MGCPVVSLHVKAEFAAEHFIVNLRKAFVNNPLLCERFKLRFALIRTREKRVNSYAVRDAIAPCNCNGVENYFPHHCTHLCSLIIIIILFERSAERYIRKIL